MTRHTNLPEVGARLAAARGKRGLSQGTVARLAGIAPSYLSRIETGKVQPTFRTALKVASALKVSPDEIVGSPALSHDHGACPISTSGRCMLDLIRSEAQATRIASGEIYTPREIRLLQRLAQWMQGVSSDRLRAMEILLDEMTRPRSKAS
jgi:transcriptional regulator with XRE-family HTH domain